MSQEWRAKVPRKRAGVKAVKGTEKIEPLSVDDWKLQIKLAQRRNDEWERRCDDLVKRYRAEHLKPVTNAVGSVGAGSGMNVLWSNVQTLQPSIYGRQPVPICERRFLDRDVTGRVASQILERGLRYEMGDCGFHDTVEQCVLDYLLPGRGVAWLRYEPVIGQEESSLPDRGDDQLENEFGEPIAEADGNIEAENRDGDGRTFETVEEKLLSASTKVDYIHWKDFHHSKARFWREVEWVSRTHYMSRQDCIDEFGEEIGSDIPLEMTPENDEKKGIGRQIDENAESMCKAIVHEIWNKPNRTVYMIAQGFDKFCRDPREDPLNLEGFFPCPKPLFATMTNDTLQPVPDYWEYQDQAREIDNLTNRITLLTSALKVAGVYDGSVKEIARLLDESLENKLIAVPNWASLAGKGGLEKSISFIPIKEVADVLQGLVMARDKVKQDMFEITGIADVIRGQADPRETAEAVATKGRWGSLRLQARQQNVARFCRDIIAMMGEIMAEHYPSEVLIEISGAEFDEGIGDPPPVPPKPPQPSTPAAGPPMPPPGGLSGGPAPGPQATLPAPMGIAPQPGAAGPMVAAGGPPNPMQQYLAQRAAYQAQLAAHQMQKQMLIAKAIELLRQDKLRGFRIDIETDSTVQTEANEEKQSRIEFIKATTEFIQAGFQLGQMQPDAVPMLGKMLLFGVRGFRAGRDLESTIEEFVDKMEKDAVQKANMPAPPNPEQIKAQAEAQKNAAEIQKAQIDAQSSAADNQREIVQKKLDQQIDLQQLHGDMLKMQQDAALHRQEFEMKMAEMAQRMQMERETHAQEREKMHLEHRQHIEKLMMTPKSSVEARK